MKTTIVFIALVGTMAGLLIPVSDKFAKYFWPGPTVKGPGDMYAQAFQVLICIAGLVILAVLASVLGLILASSINWRTGQWLSSIPVVCVVLVFGLLWLLSRK